MKEDRILRRLRRCWGVSFGIDGLYVLLRTAEGDRPALGLVIKPKSRKIFSERNGGWRGRDIGPLYVRTYARPKR